MKYVIEKKKTYIEVLSIKSITEGRVVDFGVLLPNCYGYHGHPDRSDNEKFRQVEYQKAAIVLPQAVINAQPEHEKCTEETGLEDCIKGTRKPRVHQKPKRK